MENHKKIRQFSGHKARVGALAWNGEMLTSGSRDRTIINYDTRDPRNINVLQGHKQEVCGLKWNMDMLASGGNDNKLLVWDNRQSNPMLTLSEHTAAVKAISWSPHQVNANNLAWTISVRRRNSR
jgi:cell division cycle 20-like protein 1 (cofactor of APC complex)